MSFAFNEDLLQFIWENQLYANNELKTISGDSISIINQGFLNKNSGPDFENAKIKINDTLFIGAVEIHLDAKDWSMHSHHTDAAYNNVVLHVCYTANENVVRQDGTSIPTLELKDRINSKALFAFQKLMEEKAFVSCANILPTIDSFSKLAWIDRVLIERLEDRCASFNNYQTHSNGNWSQTFYTAVVRAFGMPINKQAFEQIAFKLSFELVQRHSASLFQLEALFLGIAGVLQNVDSADLYADGLQKEYKFLASKYNLDTIDVPLKFGRMRPMSLPTLKLAQLAALWHHSPNLVSTVLSLPDLQTINELLNFDLSDYWNTHYTLGKSSAEKSKSLSNSAKQLLLLNAIIPFVFYYEKSKNNGDTDHAIQYLNALKSEKNSIISSWKSLGWEVENAYTSQALLHLYKHYCVPKMCLSCNIGRKILLKEV